MVIGISADPMSSHSRFRDSLGLPFSLLSDPDKKIMRLYQVARRITLIRNKRVTYLVNKTGVIGGVFHHEIAFGQHVPDVLAALRTINK